MALRFDRPRFDPMDRDRRVDEGRYIDEDPSRLARQIEQAADQLAHLLDELSDSEWERAGVYNWPTTAERDVTWIARHTVHELAHHLLDISRSVDPAAGPASG